MRLSLDTLITLAKEGDKVAEKTAIWLDSNRSGEAHTVHHPSGYVGIGAGYIGIPFSARVVRQQISMLPKPWWA